MITKTCPQKHYVWLLVLMHMHNYRTNMKHFTAMQEFAQTLLKPARPVKLASVLCPLFYLLIVALPWITDACRWILGYSVRCAVLHRMQ